GDVGATLYAALLATPYHDARVRDRPSHPERLEPAEELDEVREVDEGGAGNHFGDGVEERTGSEEDAELVLVEAASASAGAAAGSAAGSAALTEEGCPIRTDLVQPVEVGLEDDGVDPDFAVGRRRR